MTDNNKMVRISWKKKYQELLIQIQAETKTTMYSPRLKRLTDDQYQQLLDVAAEEREIFLTQGPKDLVGDPMNYIASGEFLDRDNLLDYLENAISNCCKSALDLLTILRSEE